MEEEPNQLVADPGTSKAGETEAMKENPNQTERERSLVAQLKEERARRMAAEARERALIEEQAGEEYDYEESDDRGRRGERSWTNTIIAGAIGLGLGLWIGGGDDDE